METLHRTDLFFILISAETECFAWSQIIDETVERRHLTIGDMGGGFDLDQCQRERWTVDQKVDFRVVFGLQI